MDEYLNEDYCVLFNDASASSFGWNFQSNAGIFLFLKKTNRAINNMNRRNMKVYSDFIYN